MKNLIVVSNRLPVTIGQTIEKSSGGLVAAMEGVSADFNLKWVGWAGGTVGDESRKKEIATELKDRFSYYPVFLTEAEASNYYTGFSNSSLWPMLHYMVPYSRYEEQWFDYYQRVNSIFSETVLEIADEEDAIWVNDYHLMLLPTILKDKNPHLKIGFFLHTPFPSYEIFRCHPKRRQIIEGLLGADLIGFHTFGYLRHFRSTVLRILGIESEIECITHDRHKTEIGVYPIGINSKKFEQTLQSQEYFRCLNDYRQVYKGMKIVLGVERLDYTKGIPRRLDAIERYLNSRESHDDIIFIFVSVPSREDVPEYSELVETVEAKVSQINGRFSTIKNVPIHFLHKSVEFPELCALYSLADVCMVTPLIDGMNLVAKEYLACHHESTGMLILSEFAGAAQELPNAIIVNPYNINRMAEALENAFTLNEKEKHRRNRPMQERVMQYNARNWARSFVSDLISGIKESEFNDQTSRVVNIEEITEVISPFVQANNIAFFLDYDGTLAEIKAKPAEARPNQEIEQLFRKLKAKQNINVYIISGRKKEDIDEWIEPHGFNLIAEHGYFYKLENEATWNIFDEHADLLWMNQVIEILNQHAGMTPGSSVEVKTSSVVWHYREADPEFGSWKANQLVSDLYEILSNLPVEVHHGKKIVEVSSIQVNKGIVVEHILGEHNYDAALCAGDDETDESIFRINDPRILSIKVGEGETAARYRIHSPGKFRKFIENLLDHL